MRPTIPQRLISLVLYAGGFVTLLNLAGSVEKSWSGQMRIDSLWRLMTRGPSVVAALTFGDSAVCDVRALNPTMKLLAIGATRGNLMSRTVLVEKRPGGILQWVAPLGTYWAPEGTDIFYVLAEQSLDVYQSGDHCVRPGDTVLDCGANIGAFTRLALNRGAAKVVAIDPVPRNVASLHLTFAKEIAEGRVVVAPVGVWDKKEIRKMTVYDNSAMDSFVMRDRQDAHAILGEIDLPLTTLDALATDLLLPRIDFIKMDIEGAERRALLGAQGTIRKFKPRLSIATENLEDDHQAVPRTIRSFAPGYESSCGACRVAGPWRIRPDIMFFQQRP